MTNRSTLTDRQLANLKPAEPGKRYKVADAVVPGLVIRVTDKGGKAFVLIRRWDGARTPSPRSIGTYPAMSLADARDKARDWLASLERGIDPSQAERRQSAVEELRKANTFGAVAE